jgi:hypothetical protein
VAVQGIGAVIGCGSWPDSSAGQVVDRHEFPPSSGPPAADVADGDDEPVEVAGVEAGSGVAEVEGGADVGDKLSALLPTCEPVLGPEHSDTDRLIRVTTARSWLARSLPRRPRPRAMWLARAFAVTSRSEALLLRDR